MVSLGVVLVALIAAYAWFWEVTLVEVGAGLVAEVAMSQRVFF